jgi:hypothetical protein
MFEMIYHLTMPDLAKQLEASGRTAQRGRGAGAAARAA